MLTKTQEIAILTEAATKLGPNSYLGIWLTTFIPMIERDIRSDGAIDYDLVKMQAECLQLRTEAEDEGKRIIERATAECVRVRKLFDRDLAAAKSRGADALREIENMMRRI